MRIHLRLTPNREPVPFNYQHYLTGVLHKWLGQNDLHDKISLYSFSWLRGEVDKVQNGLNFSRGANLFVSFWEGEFVSELVQGIVDEPQVAFGMEVDEVQIAKTPNFREKWRFKVSSPVLVRKNNENNIREHLTYNDVEAGKFLKRTLNRKIEEAGISCRDFQISFDTNYSGAQTKLIKIRDTKLKASLCPVLMNGDPKAIEFAWNVGIGELTGSGFGSLC